MSGAADEAATGNQSICRQMTMPTMVASTLRTAVQSRGRRLTLAIQHHPRETRVATLQIEAGGWHPPRRCDFGQAAKLAPAASRKLEGGVPWWRRKALANCAGWR